MSRAGERCADKLGGVWRLASGRSEGQQEGFMEETLDHPWLDVEHRLQSWRGKKET